MPRDRLGPCVARALVLALSFRAALAAATPPPGFVDRLLVDADSVTGVLAPTAVRAEPGTGNLWITEKGAGVVSGTARVRVRDAATGAMSTALIHSCVDSQGERGLLDLVFDPAFTVNHAVYLYYTRRYDSAGACYVSGQSAGSRNLVSRFFETGGQLAGEVVLLSGPPLGPFSTIHNGGGLAFADDGRLLVSMGDGGAGPVDTNPARSLSDLRGKVLRIEPDGSIPADNPFLGVAGARPEIWARGFRNPFRLAVAPGGGTVIIGDVGESSWEEADFGIPGADYGWPCYEADVAASNCSPAPAPGSLTFPVFAYSHTGPTPPANGGAIVAGPVYDGVSFPSEYAGRWFFADYVAGWIQSARLDASGGLSDVRSFLTGAAGPVDLAVGPDGCLLYAAINVSQVRDVCYVGGTNGQPAAVAAGGPVTGSAPLEVYLNGAGSADPDGDPLSFGWDLGDGRFSARAFTSEIYGPGAYQAVLTVDDGRGEANSMNSSPPLRIVSGNDPPTPTILTPAPGGRYHAGDVIGFSGLGTDPQEGALPASAFAWTVVFHHATHTHPFLGPLIGITSGAFTIPAAGEADPNVAYEVRLQVSDKGVPLGPSGILSREVSLELRPIVSHIVLAADPPGLGLELQIDGTLAPSPLAIDSVAGWPRQLTAPTPQAAAGRTFDFEAWSDGGAATHDITSPDTDTTLTARFTCPTLSIPSDLDVSITPSGDVHLGWPDSTDPCHQDLPGQPGWAVYRGATARPAQPPGSFPADPPFSLEGTTSTNEFTLVPGPGAEVYLVLEIGRDGRDGPSGHY